MLLSRALKTDSLTAFAYTGYIHTCSVLMNNSSLLQLSETPLFRLSPCAGLNTAPSTFPWHTEPNTASGTGEEASKMYTTGRRGTGNE